ncbi:MAG: A/G-specific adenine glycosylase [Pseudomonadota bacterium]
MPVDIPAHIAHKILAHFSTNARDLPWRNPPGYALPLDDPDWPYRVWLSEVMLQQTTVAAVTPYFERFTTRWPSVAALAAADDAEVMSAWAGLGYYARARNLLACARAVAAGSGHFPEDEVGLRALPGIGTYTAAAISAFAFGKRAVVVDGNIERVIARLFAIETPMPAARAEIYEAMDALTPDNAAGDFAQGLMDLARSLCTPRNPRCMLCPVMESCAGRDAPQTYPVKAPKTKRPERAGTAWWIQCDGEVLLVRRPESGLLGGMRALPSGEWSDAPAITPPFAGDWQSLGTVPHIFTHFRLTLNIQGIRLKRGCKPQLDGEWWNVARLDDAGLPSLFAKAAVLAMTWKDI